MKAREITIDDAFCPKNHRCPVIRTCPTGAIKQESFGAPVIDDSKCTRCGICTRYCNVFKCSGC